MSRPRVFLRPPGLADLGEFVAQMRESRLLHAPWLSMPQTPERYAAYLERAQRDTNAYVLACRREDGAIVGRQPGLALTRACPRTRAV